MITKKVNDGAIWRPYWERDFTKAKTDILSLGSEGFLRDVLGEKYDKIVNLDGLKLVRGNNGEILGHGAYAQEYHIRTREPPAFQPVLTQRDTNSLVNSRPAASPKRRAEPTFDQENMPPAAKRSITIDLCSDDEDEAEV